jgi:spermidine synthase
MRKLLFLSFFILGLFSIISQTLIFRELMANFYGNELFSAVILGGWLIGVGLGSLLFSKFFEKINSVKILIFSHFFGPLILYFLLILIRLFKIKLGGIISQIPDLLPSLVIAIFISFPLAFLLGVQFVAGAKLLKNPNQGYLWETLGFIVGGLLLTLIFAKINLVVPPQDLTFKNQNLVTTRNSPFANLAITKSDSQYNFYQNSILSFSSQKDLSLEEFAHLPLLFHFRPQKVLVIGGSLQILSEILKHNPQEIYFLEIDPELVKLERKYLSFIDDKKIRILNLDARYYLQKNQEKFDLILLNLGDPSNLFLNRFYTKEFFKNLKQNLNENGIFSFFLSFSPSFPNEELKALNISIFKTLTSVFPEVKIFPHENILYLASEKPFFEKEILERFEKRNLQTLQFLSKNHLQYLLENPRNQFFQDLFNKAQGEINSDFFPKGYFFTNLFWISHFQPKVSKFLLKNSSEICWILIGVLFLILIFLLFKKNLLNLSFLSMLVAAFSFLSFEILIIFLYQIFFGYLYYKISMLIALAMLGLALGTFFGQRYYFFDFKKIHLAFAILFFLSSFLFNINSFLLFFLIILAGFFCGLLFSIANRIYLKKNKNFGTIYAADLIGAALAGFLFPIFFIPILGVLNSLGLLFLLNLLCFIV